MKRTWKWLGLTAAIAYFVWPADLLPGIVADDIVALVAALVPFVAAAKQLRDRKKQEALPPAPAEQLPAQSDPASTASGDRSVP